MTQAEANQLLDQFKAVYAGQKADYYGYLGECLSLNKRWLDTLINKSVPGLNKGKQQAPASGNGKGSGYYTNFANLPALHPYFTPEPWNPAKTYPRGSMVVYSPTSHIAIYENSGATAATVFEQNADPDSSAAHTAQRGNSRIDGILILKIDAPAPPAPVQKGDKKMNDAEEQDAYRIVLERPREGAPSGRTGIDFMRDAQGELNQKRAAKDSQNAALNQTITDLQNQITAMKNQAEELAQRPSREALDVLQKQLDEALLKCQAPVTPEAPKDTTQSANVILKIFGVPLARLIASALTKRTAK